MGLIKSLLVSAGLVAFAFSPAVAQDAGMKKWVKGKGWVGYGGLRTRLER